jgi:putative two-component system response regulator
VLLDLHMPFMSGEDVLTSLRASRPTDGYLPVIMLTGDLTAEAKRRAFRAGARDFVGKPYDRDEVLLRIRSHLAIRRAQEELHHRNRGLQQDLLQHAEELRRTQVELLDRLARAAEFRDDSTGEHARRVGALSARIAEELGFHADAVELIRRAATLHDVGKIGISDDILRKPGKLTDAEMAVMRNHVTIGAEILGGGANAYLEVAERIALTHHEWWDGNGYRGLRGDEIPIEGRIVAVADVFDALTHERCYKGAWPVHRAVTRIVSLRGRQFDPAVVDAFLRLNAGAPATQALPGGSPSRDTRAGSSSAGTPQPARPSLVPES